MLLEGYGSELYGQRANSCIFRDCSWLRLNNGPFDFDGGGGRGRRVFESARFFSGLYDIFSEFL
jgi:hypothetical protein